MLVGCVALYLKRRLCAVAQVDGLLGRHRGHPGSPELLGIAIVSEPSLATNLSNSEPVDRGTIIDLS